MADETPVETTPAPEPAPAPEPPPAPTHFTITVVFNNGKRVPTEFEGSYEEAKAAAKQVFEDGVSTDVDGVCTLYPASHIAKITVTAC